MSDITSEKESRQKTEELYREKERRQDIINQNNEDNPWNGGRFTFLWTNINENGHCN